MDAGIRVVVVDDHPLFRQGVIQSLAFEEDIHLVGEAETGRAGLDLIRRLHPEVAIVDVNLPDINGQMVALRVRQERLPTRVILLTAYDDPAQRLFAMQAGAHAYSSKEIRPETLAEMIRVVAQGGYMVGEQILEAENLNSWLQTQVGALPWLDPVASEALARSLSEREMEVLRCMVEGLSNKEIALTLEISQQTVKNHVTSILRKLGVSDRTQAVVCALRYGWVRVQ